MSILDDAIREHLELKRQHGADDAELKRLEDEAFGPPARPEEDVDPFAEAPTEFLTAPGAEGGEEAPKEDATALLEDDSQAGRRINVADLQEPPPPPEAPDDAAPEAPAEEEHPAMEHEAVTEPPAPAEAPEDAGHNTEERHAIAEQPTEMFDVEEHLGAGEAASPSDEELADAERSEPRLAPVDPVEEIEASAPSEAPPSDEEIEERADEFDEFFGEQRLSDELNRALEAPADDEPAFPATEEAEEPPAPADEATQVHPLPAEHRNFAEEEEDEGEQLGFADAEEPAAPEPADDEPEHPAARHDPDHQDALEDTPDFLADDPEDENLWFEQRPPKDIDFGD